MLDSIEEPGSGVTLSERIAVANFVDKISARDTANGRDTVNYDAIVAAMTEEERAELRELIDRVKVLKRNALARIGRTAALEPPAPVAEVPVEPVPAPVVRPPSAQTVGSVEPIAEDDHHAPAGGGMAAAANTGTSQA